MYKPRFKVVFSNERILSPSGLGIVGGMLAKSDFVKRCNRIPVDKKRSEPQIKSGDILLTYKSVVVITVRTAYDNTGSHCGSASIHLISF